MAVPKINSDYEAKKDQAKKLIAAGGCHAIQFWSRTDAQRLCPEGYEDFPPIEAPIYSSEWAEAAKKAIQLIRSGLEILEPPPASIEQEAARMYPYDYENYDKEDHERVKAIRDAMRLAHIRCAGMYTGEIEKGREAIDILKALCALKKHKDANGKDEYYEAAQPEVWKIANKFLEKL